MLIINHESDDYLTCLRYMTNAATNQKLAFGQIFMHKCNKQNREVKYDNNVIPIKLITNNEIFNIIN